MATAAELVILLTAKDAASSVIKGLGNSLGGFGAAGKVATAALASFATAGAGIVAGLGASIGAAADFEAAMSAVAAVADGGTASLAALSAKALELGQDSSLAGIGATDAARAMQELAAAGISTEDILSGAARGALLLASAGGIDVARAAEIASNALNAFGLSGTQAGHVADLLAGAANASSADVNDLGESLKFIAPIAHSMGISIEDVTATLAELGSQGIKGSQAGTSLRQILVSLSSPSKEAAQAIKDLGLQFFDGAGHMKDFGQISGELQTKLAGLTDQQRAAALSTIFGSEALSAATILYGQGAEGLKKYLDQVDQAGSAAAAGATRNNNLKGSIEQLKSAFETAQIALGQAFLPALKGLVDTAASAVSAAIPLIQAWGPRFVAMLTTGITAVAGFGKAIGGAVGAVVDSIGKLASGQITFAQFIGGMQIFVATILGKLGELAAKAAPYLGAFFSAIGTFISGAAPQILAQMGLWAASFVGWITTTAIPFLLPKLGEFLAAIGTWATGTALPAIGTFFVGIAQAFGNWITTTAIPFLQTNLPLWLTALTTWITGTALPAIGAAAAGLASGLADWITTTAVPYLLTNLPLWLAALSTWITGTALPAIQQAAMTLATSLSDWITTSAIPFLQANLPLWLAALGEWITGTALPAIQAAALGLGTALADWITTTAIPAVLAAMPAWVTAVIGGIQQAVAAVAGFGQLLGAAIGGAIAVIVPLAQQFGAVFQEQLPAIIALGGQLKGVWDALLGAMQPLKPVGEALAVLWGATIAVNVGILLGALGGLVGMFSGILPGAIQIASGTLTVIQGVLQAVTAVVTGMVNTVSALLHGDWAGAWTAATQAANDFSAATTTILQGAWTIIQGIFSAAIGGIVGLVTGFVSTIGGFFQALYTQLTGDTTNFGAMVQTAWTTISTTISTTVTGIVSDVTTGFGNAVTAATTAMTNLATAVTTGIGNAKTAIVNGVNQFEGIVLGVGGALFNAGASIIGQLAAGIDSAIGAAIQKVRDGLDKIASLLPHSEPKDATSPLRGLADAGKSIFTMLAEGIGQGAPVALKAAFDASGGIAEAITKTLGPLATLTDTGSSNSAGAVMKRFAADFAVALDTMKATAGAAGDFLDQARAYKDLILMAVAEIKAAQAALNTVNVGGGLTAPTLAGGDQAGQNLGNGVADGIRRALDIHSPSQVMAAIGRDVVAGLVEGMSSAEQDALSKAAQVAGNVADAVSKALDAFSKLSGFSAPPTSAIYAFGKTLRAAINDLALIAEQVTTEASDLAAKFGEGAAKAVSVFSGGIDGFLKLKDYVAPAPSAIYAFGKTLRLAIADLAIVAEQVTTDSSDLAGKFSDGAGKAIAVIGGGVEGFLKLAGYVAPAPAAVDAFAATVGQIVTRLAAAAGTLGDKPIAQAQAFGEAAGAIFSALKSGLDLFIEIDKPGNWPTTDWLQPLIELMAGVLGRGGQLLSQSQQLRDIADAFVANIQYAAGQFAVGIQGGGLSLSANLAASGSAGGGGGGVTNNYYVSGNTLLSKDTSTQQMVSSIVTTQQGRTISYSAG